MTQGKPEAGRKDESKVTCTMAVHSEHRREAAAGPLLGS